MGIMTRYGICLKEYSVGSAHPKAACHMTFERESVGCEQLQAEQLQNTVHGPYQIQHLHFWCLGVHCKVVLGWKCVNLIGVAPAGSLQPRSDASFSVTPKIETLNLLIF